MADMKDGVLNIERALENADVFDIQVGGDDQATWTAPSGEAGISFNHAVRKLFENGGLPAAPFKTKVAMQTDGASLADGQLAQVYNDVTNNGLYVKTGGAWTKASYDPFLQSKNYVDKTSLIINVSVLSGNYNLSITNAIALIPTEYRRKNIGVEFNNGERYEFKGMYTPENFLELRYWLRVSHRDMTSELNLIKDSMVHRGFYYDAAKGINGVSYSDDSAVLIIPVHRFYDGSGTLKNVKINAYKRARLVKDRAGFLDKDMSVVSAFGITGTNIVDKAVPSNATHLFINIANNGKDNTPNLDSYTYARQGYEHYSALELKMNQEIVVQNNRQAFKINYNPLGEVFYSTERDIFYHPKTKVYAASNSVTLAEFINDIYFVPKKSGSIYNSAGKVRRVFVDYVERYNGGITVRISVESSDNEGVYETKAISAKEFNGINYLDSTRVVNVWSGNDGLDLVVITNPSLITELALGLDSAASESEVKESYLLKRYWEMPELRTTRFDNFDISKTRFVSNYDSQPAIGKLAETFVSNGKKTYELVGSMASSVHEQSALTAAKFIEVAGKKSVTVFCDTTADALYKQPQATPMRNPSAYKVSDNSIGQYVHPDVVCIPSGFLGYKYWMINSHYPYSVSTVEDAEIFVSNDGVNWDRILHPKETIPTTIQLRIPVSYWDIYDPRSYDTRERLFMPIPRASATMEFHTQAGIAQGKITSYLAHDPAISFQDGWLNFYCTYNFDLDITSSKARYTVCYRTQDFVNWEVVRADGSSFVYDETSAQKIFSSTDGVRNHIAYFEDSTATDASKQFVRVSDTLWYCYAVRSQGGTTLVRYTGTSPYQFDWINRTTCTATPSYLNVLWHIGVQYIDGKFYLMNGSSLAESTDGVAFTNHPNTFFEVGMQAESYKPYFVKGHDGKMKVGISLGVRTSTVEPYINEQLNQSNTFSRPRYVSQTLCCEYPSLQHIINASKGLRNDAFVDVVLQIHREQIGDFEIHIMPKLKGKTTLKNVTFRKGDYVRVVAYLNTIAQGKVVFEGVLIDERT